MSRRKSDAQLDAEAAARVVSPAILPNPYKPLTQWRAAYAGEPPDRTTSSHPPEMTEEIDGVKFRVIDPGAGVGLSMSGAILRYLDGSGGRQFPVHDALTAWDRYCRSKHQQWADHRGRPVCAEIAWHVIRDRWSIFGASRESGVSFARGERLLQLSVKWMAQRHEQWMREVTPSTGHDREMCDVCRREDAA